MRLLVMVMQDRDGELVPVRDDRDLAARVTGEVLGEPVTEVVSAADTDADDDYWMTVPHLAVTRHLVAPATMQAYRPGAGLVAATVVTGG